jgi:hypothetical protein
MVFKNNIPQPTDNLSDSQVDLLNNNSQLDTSFGIDHYTFSNLTVNNGKHNQVTTPLIVGGVHPVTAASEPKFYAMQDYAAVGVLQYSRGGSDAVPTPVTSLQSTSAAIALAIGADTPILDFTGIARAFCTVSAVDMPNLSTRVYAWVIWNGSAFSINIIAGTNVALILEAAGNILRLRNGTLGALNNIYWSLDFIRIQ